MPSTPAQVDSVVLELQKQLYKDQLIRQANFKRGSKYYPINIEPFALERTRLALPFTDADRKLRKQWLEDQVLSEREPVHVPQWERVNIFRRLYNKPYEALHKLLTPIIGQNNSILVRRLLPKMVNTLLFSWVLWYQIKYSPRSWEQPKTGIGVSYLLKPRVLPGEPGFPMDNDVKSDYCMEDFTARKALRGAKLVTSGPV